MAARFIALAWRGPGQAAKAAASRAALQGFREVLTRPGLCVLANDEAPYVLLPADQGVVLGVLFSRDDEPARVERFTPRQGASIVATGGRSLIRAFWGAYVAFVASDDQKGAQVVREPSGGLAAYHLAAAGFDVVCSDLQAAIDLDLVVPSLDIAFAAHFLAYPLLRSRRTGLSGVREVLAGTRLTLPWSIGSEDCVWSPWDFAAPNAVEIDAKTAARRIRIETHRCVRAWAGAHAAVVLELSGGLDSSIVASCLAGGEPTVTCVNLVSPWPDGDERLYARLVADRCGYSVREITIEPQAVDLARSSGDLRLRPGGHGILRPLDSALCQVASLAGASAFFTGAGGDNVYCCLSTAGPAADALLAHGPSVRFWRALGDLSALHGCTYWRAAHLALRKALRPPRVGAWRRDESFLIPSALPAWPDDHPWLAPPRGALPGKLDHVQALMGIQNYLDAFERRIQAPIISPLLSQPLVELCLQTPTWLWIEGGRDRALARAAFADVLPDEVVRRRSKGNLKGFAGAVFERDRDMIAEFLTSGVLAREGLIDVSAVQDFFRRSDPTRGSTFFRLLQMVDVENWARALRGAG